MRQRLETLILLGLLALHVVNSKYQSICDYSSRDKLRSFLVDQVNVARTEINSTTMRSLRNYKATNDPTIQYFLNKFYYRHYGTYVWNLENTTALYVRIYKCGSEAIIQNFNKFGGTKKPSRIIGNPKQLMNMTVNGTFNIFTYVRDPMSRFEGGMTESAAFKLPKSKNNELFQVTSTDMIEKYIQNLTNFQFPNLGQVEHIAALSGSFFQFNVNIICTLENFTTCWENEIVPTYNLQTMKFNQKRGQHLTSIHHPNFGAKNDPLW